MTSLPCASLIFVTLGVSACKLLRCFLSHIKSKVAPHRCLPGAVASKLLQCLCGAGTIFKRHWPEYGGECMPQRFHNAEITVDVTEGASVLRSWLALSR